ncbi:MAG: Fic family protein [Pseudomonadota bacterium]
MVNSGFSIGALLAETLAAAGTSGISPEELGREVPDVSRSTLNRRLAELVAAGVARRVGAGRATRYVSASPLVRADIDAYFRVGAQQRQVAVFRQELIAAQPNIDREKAIRCESIQAIATPVDKRFLTNFLVDFSWGSSILEGGSYSALDTQALIQYGQKNKDKPTADALLVLDHKMAVEFLWTHREVTRDNICAMHALVTHDHGLPEAAESDHFLPAHQRGKPRDYEEVNLGASAYLPPFRPGTGFASAMLDEVVAKTREMRPVEAALYLMTRIPYVQIFANGNKRTSRLAANAALLAGGLLPFSFADVDKADYIRGMAAFYELGSMLVIEQTFIEGYARSVVRGSDIPVRMRTHGFDIEAVARELVQFINTGRRPADRRALLFLK